MTAATARRPATAWDRLAMPLVASLTLGLAPFTPEPHVVEKIRWVLAGGADLKLVDAFDLVLHGAPWVWLGWTLVGLAGGRGAVSKDGPVEGEARERAGGA